MLPNPLDDYSTQGREVKSLLQRVEPKRRKVSYSVTIRLTKEEFDELCDLANSEGIKESATIKIIWEKGVSYWKAELKELRASRK